MRHSSQVSGAKAGTFSIRSFGDCAKIHRYTCTVIIACRVKDRDMLRERETSRNTYRGAPRRISRSTGFPTAVARSVKGHCDTGTALSSLISRYTLAVALPRGLSVQFILALSLPQSSLSLSLSPHNVDSDPRRRLEELQELQINNYYSHTAAFALTIGTFIICIYSMHYGRENIAKVPLRYIFYGSTDSDWLLRGKKSSRLELLSRTRRLTRLDSSSLIYYCQAFALLHSTYFARPGKVETECRIQHMTELCSKKRYYIVTYRSSHTRQLQAKHDKEMHGSSLHLWIIDLKEENLKILNEVYINLSKDLLDRQCKKKVIFKLQKFRVEFSNVSSRIVIN